MFMHNWGWWGMIGGLGMLLFWLLLIGGTIWLIATLARSAQNPGRGSITPESPQEILRRRLATGEITPQQYDDLRLKLGV